MFADITSANVVGYKAEGLREGFTMMTPCFVNVADTKAGVDLVSFTPGGEYSAGDIEIQTLTELGFTDKTYTFTKDRKGNWFWKDVDEGTTIEEGDVTFDPGKGLWVAGVDGATITIPGVTL